MGGSLPGPWAPWEFVGSTTLLATGSTPVEGKFPSGIQEGDLVVAIMTPRTESIGTTMSSAGWQRWAQGPQDYVCTARFAPGLEVPRWRRGGANSIFVAVLVFRASGWSAVKLESHVSPAQPVAVTTRLQNELLLAIGITPQTTRGWACRMNGADPEARLERALSPAVQVYSANIDFPRLISGVAVDALSGDERNLILTIS